ncbi:MAG TPA: glycosyltransferase family 4 protein [Candidatus Dormibacteraeota bacterium]|nr:glycosyltransferase family 4 protein [Candidatus Dormibacteraeota bacterium]
MLERLLSPGTPLRVALVAPPWLPIPPGGYGGIEQVVYLLARELQARGHDVTVFGRQGSSGEFDVVALAPPSWSDHLGSRDQQARECLHLLRAYAVVNRRPFDVVHDHTGFTGMLLGACMPALTPMVATLHGDLTEADAEFLSSIDDRVALVGITAAQAGQVAGVAWRGVVHNAVDASELSVGREKQDYLVELARITPEKGQHLAIEMARRAGRPLVLAGKVDPGADDYFREQIEPHLGDDVRWIEDVAGAEKARLLAEASAMVFPIEWAEPFGLAMVEAMASGTPVLAFPNGAAPEVVEDGVTGFIARDVDGLVDALGRVDQIDSERCAARSRERFSPARMADGYEAVYRDALRRSWEARG